MNDLDIFALYGDPVSHSRSPLMHNYVFNKLNYPAVYTAIHLLDATQLKRDFINRKLAGANVTIPHKKAAFMACDEVRGFAKEAEVVNTLINENGKLIGYNTDADGFLYAIEKFSNIKTILLFGAGGTAEALTKKFISKGLKVTVVNRSEKRLQSFKSLSCFTATWSTFVTKKFDLIVNTTSAGLKDDSYPINKLTLDALFNQAHYVVDIIYGKITPFLKFAKHKGLPAINGEAMLIGQGVLANEIFTKKKLKKSDILFFMKDSFKLL